MNALTDPVHPDASPDGSRGELFIECLLHSEPKHTLSPLENLRLVPYGLYLNFQQGRNIPPMVLAWRDHPEIDLADADRMGYDLRAVGQPGHRDEPAPQLIADFHAPIDALINELAPQLERMLSELPAESCWPVRYSTENPMTPRQRAAATFNRAVIMGILAQIEAKMILREGVYDEDSGEFLGLGPDIAPGLVGLWLKFSKEHRLEPGFGA